MSTRQVLGSRSWNVPEGRLISGTNRGCPVLLPPVPFGRRVVRARQSVRRSLPSPQPGNARSGSAMGRARTGTTSWGLRAWREMRRAEALRERVAGRWGSCRVLLDGVGTLEVPVRCRRCGPGRAAVMALLGHQRVIVGCRLRRSGRGPDGRRRSALRRVDRRWAMAMVVRPWTRLSRAFWISFGFGDRRTGGLVEG